MSELNYEHVFNVLGISGGIDSTVVAAICHEVSKKTGIPLIGRSLPIKNKSDEFATSVHVGEAFCALQGCEDGPKIPKSKMGIIIKELKAMFPAADGKQIADLVKSCVI